MHCGVLRFASKACQRTPELCVCIIARVCIRSRCDVRQYLQAAEDALLGEMAAVKAGMERRQKREKRRKLEQKKKSRVRAAQAAAGRHTLLD